MLLLSLDRINLFAPYHLASTSNANLTFDTDFGVSYTIGFELDDSIWQDGAYQFYIINTNQKKSPNDPKVRKTIECVIEEFFQDENRIMLYICETGDDKQLARGRLFSNWFSQSPLSSIYHYESISLLSEGIINYAAIMIRKDCPQKKEIIDDFHNFIELMQQKP